jgi:hypothetical protein
MLPSCHYIIPARSAFLFYHVICLPPFYHESAIGGLKLVSIATEICRIRECAGVLRRMAETAVAPGGDIYAARRVRLGPRRTCGSSL